MAYVANTLSNAPNEQKKKKQNQAMLSNQLPGNTIGAPTPAQPARVNRGGSQFPDISNYLSQNKAASNRLASNMGNQLVNQGVNANKILQNASSQFTNQVNQGTVGANQQILDNAQNDPNALFNKTTVGPRPMPNVAPPTYRDWRGDQNGNRMQGFLSQGQKGKKGKEDEGKDFGRFGGRNSRGNKGRKGFNWNGRSFGERQPQAPVQSFDPNKESFDELGQMLNAQYTGPTNLGDQEGFVDVSDAVRKASGADELAETATGRNDLLQDVYGQGGASSGVSSLDNLLLGQSGDILSNAAGKFGNLDENLADTEGKALEAAQLGAQTTDETRQSALDSIYGEGGYLYDLQGDFEKKKEQDEAPRTWRTRGGAQRRGNIDNSQSKLDARLKAINDLLGENYEF